jgi:DNA-binding response OmpR family regulator
MAAILIVEDEVDICNLIRAQLEAEGHTVFQAFDGLTALKIVDEHRPQLVVLDWMLPGMDGLSVCRKLRQNYLMPIIMLTARTEEIDRVLGLEVGADDYISKPFSIREVLARVRAMLRRVELDSHSLLSASTTLDEDRMPTGENRMPTGGIPTFENAPPIPYPPSAPIVRGPLHIYELERIVKLEGVELDLTPKEYELLLLLASHPGRAFSREFLLQQLWGYDYDGFDRTVDTHITRLRKKLGAPGEKIVTVWGVGYRFVS